MREVTEAEIRESFVNCSKGEAKRLAVPRDLADLPWADLDFLGWRDPGAPDRSYLVLDRPDGLVGVAFRFPRVQRGFLQRNMCNLCMTAHPGNGVSLMTARKPGKAGREGNSTGLHMCTDLACPLYIRGRKSVGPMRYEESLTQEEKIARMTARLDEFLEQLYA
ncbi:FBP domain-containing protein [Streptomyces sp. NPDC051940]|uniref:FBP domain-containing protein n=1 Tax=Streptomyces sp. NPDC051940 TaxID=3155675 RepID=UPI0034149AC6